VTQRSQDEELKRHPHLCFNLVGSRTRWGASTATVSRATVPGHLGRRRFRRWVQLFYASRNVNSVEPLHTARRFGLSRFLALNSRATKRARGSRTSDRHPQPLLGRNRYRYRWGCRCCQCLPEAAVARQWADGWEESCECVKASRRSDVLNILRQLCAELDGITLDELTYNRLGRGGLQMQRWACREQRE
jgi:hypothetical protein